MNMKYMISVAALIAVVGCTEQVHGKGKHNQFLVTNNSSGNIVVEITSKYTKVNPKTKHGKASIEVGKTVNMPILKDHDISAIFVTYADGAKRNKNNFKIMKDGYDSNTKRNSKVERGTLVVTDANCTVTTQKAGVTMIF